MRKTLRQMRTRLKHRRSRQLPTDLSSSHLTPTLANQTIHNRSNGTKLMHYCRTDKRLPTGKRLLIDRRLPADRHFPGRFSEAHRPDTTRGHDVLHRRELAAARRVVPTARGTLFFYVVVMMVVMRTTAAIYICVCLCARVEQNNKLYMQHKMTFIVLSGARARVTKDKTKSNRR